MVPTSKVIETSKSSEINGHTRPLTSEMSINDQNLDRGLKNQQVRETLDFFND